jgi:hypothetical protein
MFFVNVMLYFSLTVGHSGMLMVQVLCYRPEGRRFFLGLPNPSILSWSLRFTQSV